MPDEPDIIYDRIVDAEVGDLHRALADIAWAALNTESAGDLADAVYEALGNHLQIRVP